MLKSRSYWIAWTLVAGLVSVAGCGGESTQVGAIPVSGVVTLDGQPLAGATVTFSPSDAQGRAAVGSTDLDGKFKLTTLAPGDGAVPGSYAVSVTKNVVDAATTFEDPRSTGGMMTPEQTKNMMEMMSGKIAKATSSLPTKYASKDTSGFTANVAKGEKNEFTFDLKSN